MWFNRKTKNRRFEREHFLEVKLRSQQARAGRWRLASAVLSVGCGTGLGLLLLWWGGNWALNRLVFQNEAFAIRDIVVQTDGSLSVGQIQKWAGVKPGQNLLALDLAGVKRDLELVPWIQQAAVERVLPHTLNLRITEREAVVKILSLQPRASGPNYDQAVYFLDPAGYAMKPRPNLGAELESRLKEYLPRLTGVRPEDLRSGRQVEVPQIHAALRLVEDFERSPLFGLVDLNEIDVSAPEVLRVVTRQGNEIFFAPRQFDRQLARWRLVHDYGARLGKSIASLDLSITNNLPAQWIAASPVSPLNPKILKQLRTRKKHV